MPRYEFSIGAWGDVATIYFRRPADPPTRRPADPPTRRGQPGRESQSAMAA